MLFGNPNRFEIRKRIVGVDYICPPGGTVEIPDRYAYVIAVEKTLLVPADELTKPALPEPEKTAIAEPVAAVSRQPEPTRPSQHQRRER